MFYLNQDTELSAGLLYKMLNRHKLNTIPRLEKYKNYYDEKQAILGKSYADTSKPCSKTVINYCRNIVDLVAIAASGNVNDLVQTEGDVLMFNCGTASTVI